jgi:hypothetical protein
VAPPTPINNFSSHPGLDASLHPLRIAESAPLNSTAPAARLLARRPVKNLKEPLKLLVRISGVNSLLLADFCSAGILHDRPHNCSRRSRFRRLGSRSDCPECGHPMNA